MSSFHTPVLLKEVIEFIRVEEGKHYIDATVGGGGYTQEILRRGGIVLGIDVDQDAIEHVSGRWKVESRSWNIKEDNLRIIRGNFRNIGDIARFHGFAKVSGIVFDLGVSSYQLEKVERGFSFQREGPLDMRMDHELAVKAGDLINILTKGEMYELFRQLGEERYAYAISESIIRARKIKPITTTTELANVVASAVPVKRGSIHQATKAFQALRIAVNDELNNIQEALPQAVGLLENNGHLVVVSFHSLEDRIVKNMFKEFKTQGKGSILTKKPVSPSFEEIEKNNRARSAKLRVFEKYIHI